jgi:hypothetical protein
MRNTTSRILDGGRWRIPAFWENKMISHGFQPSADRSDRAPLAYVQQELSAPAEAIAAMPKFCWTRPKGTVTGNFVTTRENSRRQPFAD